MVGLANKVMDHEHPLKAGEATPLPLKMNWEIERPGLAIPASVWQAAKPVITIRGPAR